MKHWFHLTSICSKEYGLRRTTWNALLVRTCHSWMRFRKEIYCSRNDFVITNADFSSLTELNDKFETGEIVCQIILKYNVLHVFIENTNLLWGNILFNKLNLFPTNRFGISKLFPSANETRWYTYKVIKVEFGSWRMFFLRVLSHDKLTQLVAIVCYHKRLTNSKI